ncbi:ArsR/SmtB family transcription factor [Marivita hallyeonensis]|uniref:Transcriptional regulator, ArsR family n=1 Tax=Marivita hallyeonensis TaxID=996342 RepID=A0A1M5TUQ4_9RHOB|nr:winged helix-turn-helix domain-containing protein [Marivita hallyeonensis]SHH54418.1 transcriptional regulator, ArsR family [Marivita hallyeonensis]
MKHGPDIARIASLIGDPARANILTALMSGKALTAGELATEAGVSASTASSHLARLVDGGLVKEARQGRHKYFALAGDEVAQVLEALMGFAAGHGHLRTRTGPKDAQLRAARVCYNHLAGTRGIQLYDSLLARNFMVLDADTPRLTEAGERFVRELGVDFDQLVKSRAPLCRTCLDWSARRPHLAGSLGRALLKRFEEAGWAHRVRDTRIVRFSTDGLRRFNHAFPVSPDSRA